MAATKYQTCHFGGAFHIKHSEQGGKQERKLHDVARPNAATILAEFPEWTKWCAV
jgi:hypothetical protein